MHPCRTAPVPEILPSKAPNDPKSLNPAPDFCDHESSAQLLPTSQKILITVLVSFGGFNSNLSSQIVSPAIPEVAMTFQTTGAMINLTNALYMLFMGLSTPLWGPLSDIFGRRWVSEMHRGLQDVGIISAVFFLAFSVGTALSSNLLAFFVFRILSAVMGTAFQVIGPACVCDIYGSKSRGTALSWFLGGTLLAPSIGPFLGGLIVAYESWRMLFWFQTALVGLSCILVAFLLPETSASQKITETKDLDAWATSAAVLRWMNPIRVFTSFRIPRILLLGLATSSLMWNMQSLLTPVRYVINPRFNLTSPLQSGLFYLAPGSGYMAGLFFGGHWADQRVQRWVDKRGRRIPEDRLRGSLLAMGILIPGSILIYGWAIDMEVGGIPLPVICMFVQGASQMACLPCLNTYCMEVLEGKGSEVMAGNLFFRYVLAAVGTAVCIPGIDSIGVGWMSTISAGFVGLSAVGMCWVTFYSFTQG